MHIHIHIEGRGARRQPEVHQSHPGTSRWATCCLREVREHQRKKEDDTPRERERERERDNFNLRDLHDEVSAIRRPGVVCIHCRVRRRHSQYNMPQRAPHGEVSYAAARGVHHTRSRRPRGTARRICALPGAWAATYTSGSQGPPAHHVHQPAAALQAHPQPPAPRAWVSRAGVVAAVGQSRGASGRCRGWARRSSAAALCRSAPFSAARTHRSASPVVCPWRPGQPPLRTRLSCPSAAAVALA